MRNTYGYIRQGGPGQETSHAAGLMGAGGGGGKPGLTSVTPGSAALGNHAPQNPAALRPSPLAAAAAAQLALEQQHQQQQQHQQHGRAAADALAVATLSAAGKIGDIGGKRFRQ